MFDSQRSNACRHQTQTSGIHPCPNCFVDEARRKTEHDACTNFKCEDGVCPVCLNEYNTPSPDTKRVEPPVRLACGHRVGYDCLSLWLSPAPKGGNGSTCPICKYQLFLAWPSVQQRIAEEDSARLQIEEARAVSRRMLQSSIRYHQAMSGVHARVQRMPAVMEDVIIVEAGHGRKVESKSPLSKLIGKFADTRAKLRSEIR